MTTDENTLQYAQKRFHSEEKIHIQTLFLLFNIFPVHNISTSNFQNDFLFIDMAKKAFISKNNETMLLESLWTLSNVCTKKKLRISYQCSPGWKSFKTLGGGRMGGLRSDQILD